MSRRSLMCPNIGIFLVEMKASILDMFPFLFVVSIGFLLLLLLFDLIFFWGFQRHLCWIKRPFAVRRVIVIPFLVDKEYWPLNSWPFTSVKDAAGQSAPWPSNCKQFKMAANLQSYSMANGLESRPGYLLLLFLSPPTLTWLEIRNERAPERPSGTQLPARSLDVVAMPLPGPRPAAQSPSRPLDVGPVGRARPTEPLRPWASGAPTISIRYWLYLCWLGCRYPEKEGKWQPPS